MRTTGLQVSGMQFLLRRLELALVIGDARLAHDPLRNQRRSVLVGALLSLLIAGGAVMMGLLRPAPSLDGEVVVDEHGSMFVQLGEVYHPVANVASARLALGYPAELTRATAAQLAEVPQGPSIGIAAVPTLDQAEARSWFVCDTTGQSTEGPVAVVAQPPSAAEETGGQRLPVGSVLVDDGQGLWLLQGNRKTLVEANAPHAFGVKPVRVTQAFVQQFAATQPAQLPSGPTGLPEPFHHAGELFRSGDRVFMTQHGGVAELQGAKQQYALAIARSNPLPVALHHVAALPQVEAFPMLPVDAPDQEAAHTEGRGTLCVGEAAPERSGQLVLVENVALENAFVGPSGSSPVASERGLHVVDQQGVRFDVGSKEALQALGFTDPVYVPWRVLSLLIDGGMLSEELARSTLPTGADNP